MIKIFTSLYSVSVFLMWALGILVHFWTIYIAYQVSGLFLAVISFFLPFLSQVYWGYNAWKVAGFESPYIQWLIVLMVLWAIRFVLGLVVAMLTDKFQKYEA